MLTECIESDKRQDLAAAFDMPEEEAVRRVEECEDKLTVHYPDWMQ